MSNLIMHQREEDNIVNDEVFLNNHSIPMGLVLISTAQPSSCCTQTKCEESGIVSNSLYDKLVELACEIPRKECKTKRIKKSQNKNKTKRKK